jgi:hypothetical protein
MLKIESLEGQVIKKSLGTIKPKGLNRKAKIGLGHLCPREEILSLIKITYLGDVNFNNKYI